MDGEHCTRRRCWPFGAGGLALRRGDGAGNTVNCSYDRYYLQRAGAPSDSPGPVRTEEQKGDARMTTKDALHQLIDDLPESALPTAWSLLAPLRPNATANLPRILAEAPWDNEPETPEEALGVKEAYEGLARGEVVSHEELRRELGW